MRDSKSVWSSVGSVTSPVVAGLILINDGGRSALTVQAVAPLIRDDGRARDWDGQASSLDGRRVLHSAGTIRLHNRIVGRPRDCPAGVWPFLC